MLLFRKGAESASCILCRTLGLTQLYRDTTMFEGVQLSVNSSQLKIELNIRLENIFWPLIVSCGKFYNIDRVEIVEIDK